MNVTPFKAILLSSDDLRLYIIALSLKVAVLIRHYPKNIWDKRLFH